MFAFVLCLSCVGESLAMGRSPVKVVISNQISRRLIISGQARGPNPLR